MASISEIDNTFDVALNLARQSLYRFAALSLLDPRAGSWEQLDRLRGDPLPGQAAELVRGLDAAKPETLGLGERPIADLNPASVLSVLPLTQDGLNAQYEETFGLLVSKACPPYETEYIHGKYTFQRSQALGDIGGFYRAFGMQPSANLPERHDHIVLELEFMACLLDLERRAAEAETDAERRDERMDVCRGAQARFLEEHLVWWVPAFTRVLLREKIGGFYDAAALFLAALITADRSLLGIESSKEMAQPIAADGPEDCEGCALST